MDFDRECAPVTAVARSAAVELPKNMFAHEKGSLSIGDEQLEDLCSDQPHWANHNAANYKESALQTLVTVKTNGDWNVLSKVVMSLLMVPGSFVKHPDGPMMLVVSATPFGFIGYRCSYKKQNNDFVVDQGCDFPFVA